MTNRQLYVINDIQSDFYFQHTASDPGGGIFVRFLGETMEQCNIRLPAAMIAALREQGKSMGLGFSAHVRTQLTATLRNPHNILKATKDTVAT